MTSVLFYYKVNVRHVISYENNLLNLVEIYYLSSELLSVNKVNQSINQSLSSIDQAGKELTQLTSHSFR